MLTAVKLVVQTEAEAGLSLEPTKDTVKPYTLIPPTLSLSSKRSVAHLS